MLYLSRKIGESVVIGQDVKITVVDVQGKSIKLGFEYPQGVSILREELFVKLHNENQAAALAASQLAAHLQGLGSE
jgi:carbon storage regulator